MNLFAVTTRDNTVMVRAQSWYDAREWARSTYGTDLLTVVAAGAAIGTPIDIPPTPTAIERAQQHIESVRALTRRESLLEAAELADATPCKALASELRRRAASK
jgi:hypothetical protein